MLITESYLFYYTIHVEFYIALLNILEHVFENKSECFVKNKK